MARMENPEQILSKRMDALCHDIEESVKNSIDEPPPEKRFESVNMIREKAVLDVRESIQALEKILNIGIQSIIFALTELKKEEELRDLLGWFENNMDQIASNSSNEDPDLDSKTAEEQLNFPRKHIIAMHDAATYLMNEKKYDEALAVIAICLQMNPTLSPLWVTYGLILQNRGDHEAALYIFQMAAVLDEQNPYIKAHMARSWIILGNREDAELCVQEAKSLCQNFPEYSDLLQYCTDLESWMQKNQG